MDLETRTKDNLNHLAMKATQYGTRSRQIYDNIAFRIINEYTGKLTRQNLVRHYYNCVHNYETENLQS